MLVEELWGGVDVVVGAGVGAANHHDGQAGGLWAGRVVHAVIVDRWLEEVRVLLDPAMVSQDHCKAPEDLPPGQVEGHCHRHLGGAGEVSGRSRTCSIGSSLPEYN